MNWPSCKGSFVSFSACRPTLRLRLCCGWLSANRLPSGVVAVSTVSVCCSANTGYRMGMSGSLDQLVTAAAAELMAATADNHAAISERVLADLVSHFDVDFGFLRHNDHTIHATVLIAEWPRRENIPDPDPLRVVYFADADPVFAVAENLKEPGVLRPEAANADYQRNVEEGSGIPASLPCVRANAFRGRHYRHPGLRQVRGP